MNEIIRKESFHRRGWHAVVSMLMLTAGCACFVLSCIGAMAMMRRTGA